MTLKQLYDNYGTTNFQFTFIDKRELRKRHHQEWNVFFTQGFISIHNVSKNTRIRVNFPEEDHWVHEKRESEWRDGGICRGAEIKTNHFTLTADVREYIDSDNPEFDPDYHTEGENEGYLELVSKNSTINMEIPYKLATNLIKFMGGSTDLDGVRGVLKFK